MPRGGDLAYRPEVDGLRGIAVLFVVAYHLWPEALPGGFVGVDVFFVISGYLITELVLGRLASSRFSFGQFYARRVRRLFPALSVALAGTLAFSCLAYSPSERAELGRKAAACALFIPNLAMVNVLGYFDLGARQDPLMHLWSLGVEEQFYLVWPCALWALHKLGLPFRPVTALLLLASLAACVAAGQAGAGNVYYLPYDRAWELLCGACLASWPPSATPKSAVALAPWAALASAGLIAAAAAFVDDSLPYPSWLVLAAVLGAAGLLASTARSRTAAKALAWRPLVWVGLVSYPLYLFHWPVLSVMNRVWPDPFPGWALQPAALALTAALAWLVYRFLEKPIRRGSGPAAPPLLGLVMLLLGLGGLHFWRSGGPSARPTTSNHVLAPYVLPPWDAYRRGDCFLVDQPPSQFKPDCLEQGPAGEPLVVLAGDSFAAALRPGLDLLQSRQRFRLAQWTLSGCPPYREEVTSRLRYCDAVNAWVFSRISALKPDTVILCSNWDKDRGTSGRLTLSGIRATIAGLRRAGVRRVIVFGQMPLYDGPQAEITLEELPLGRLYTWRRFERRCFETDALLVKELQGSGAEFIRPLDVFCDGSGCRDSVGRAKVEPMAWDYGHLSVAGSRYLMERCGVRLGEDAGGEGQKGEK